MIIIHIYDIFIPHGGFIMINFVILISVTCDIKNIHTGYSKRMETPPPYDL